MNIIKKQYNLVWKFLKSSRNYIWIIVALFLFSTFLGFFYPSLLQNFVNNLINQKVNQIRGMGFGQLFLFIFWNNLYAAFSGMLIGIAFGIFPVITCFLNGYVVGYVAGKTVERAGFGILWSFAPHGIFEVPALFISLALGLKIGMFLFRKSKKITFSGELENITRVFLLVVVPLLLIAAVIESGLIILIG